MNKADPASPEPEKTGDGSHTLYSPQFDQLYHNPTGAVAENLHVFFKKNSLLGRLPNASDLVIFETGFGTGLNFLLLLDQYSRLKSRCKIDFYSIEAYPLKPNTSRSLNYAEFLSNPGLADELPAIFENVQQGMNRFEPVAGITLHLFIGLFEDFEPGTLKADFLFHDPFSPETNEELWTGNLFKKLLSWSSRSAVLSTYCAASRARGAMAWAGWKLAREEGAPGKREMTLASPDPDKLRHLKRVNEERLARRYENGDF